MEKENSFVRNHEGKILLVEENRDAIHALLRKVMTTYYKMPSGNDGNQVTYQEALILAAVDVKDEFANPDPNYIASWDNKAQGRKMHHGLVKTGNDQVP